VAAENRSTSYDAALAPPAPVLAPGRSCGTCNLCCKVLDIPELGKAAGQWCVHTAPRSGCAVHPDRPQSCRAFFCAWRLDPNLGPEWKPDVSRFVLSEDIGRRAITVTVDPGMPLAWKRELYLSRLKQVSESAFRQDRKVLVSVRGHITVVLPDREIPLGVLEPGEDIAIWREGSTYGARRQRPHLLVPGLTRDRTEVRDVSSGTVPARGPGQEKEAASGSAPAAEDPGFFDSVFRQAFERTAKLLDDSRIDSLQALTRTLEGRNKVLDETAADYAQAAGAECGSGCVSCCYLMVLGTPFEILSIARQILATRTPAEIDALKARLQEVAQIPLDPALRAKAAQPCALLEDGLCSAYEVRPAVCRMMLSQSRAACEACLKGAGGLIPYIDQPSKIAAAMQMGIDYALISRRKLSTEKAELSRALLVALDNYPEALAGWLSGGDPFAGARFVSPRAPANAESVIAAGRRLGLA